MKRTSCKEQRFLSHSCGGWEDHGLDASQELHLLIGWDGILWLCTLNDRNSVYSHTQDRSEPESNAVYAV